MAITQDYILKGGLSGSDAAANASLAAAHEADRQKAEQNAKLAQLIKGDQLKRQAISENQAAMDAQAKAQGLKPGTYSSHVSESGYQFDPRDPSAMFTPGERAADTKFGGEYADFTAGGGVEGAKKNLGLLEGVQKQLEAEGDKAPNMLERGVQYLPDSLRTFLTPKIKQQEDQVRTAIQSSLRQTLGAQFTEKEGEGLMRRSYDPRLSPQQNLQKMAPEVNALKQQLAQKARSSQYFEKHGTLKGLGAASGAPQTPVTAPQGGGQFDHLSDEQLQQMLQQLQGK